MHRILFTLICLIAFASCSDNNVSETHTDVAKQTEAVEKVSPLGFLSILGTYKKNRFGEWVIEAKINNKASIVTYKDIVLKIKYYSKTKTLIGSEDETILGYFKPNESHPIVIKKAGLTGTASVDIIIISTDNVE